MTAANDSLDTQQVAYLRDALLNPDRDKRRVACVPKNGSGKTGTENEKEPQLQRARRNVHVTADADAGAASTKDELQILNPSKSSPNIARVPQLNGSPRKMNRSFDGQLGGDTQPMDSQIYRLYTSMRYPNKTEANPPPNAPNHSPASSSQSDASSLTSKDSRTDGHIDILRALDESHPPKTSSPYGANTSYDDGVSPPTQFLIPPSASFTALDPPPKTPAPPSSTLRHRRGDSLATTATKTPGSALAHLFQNGQKPGPDAMSLSQLFNATQAPSSPLPQAIRSDPVFERPSPDFAHALPRLSSPALEEPASSPVRAKGKGKGRAGWREDTEPRETYLTMKESQERRERMLSMERDAEHAASGDSDCFDELVTLEDERAAQRRLRRRTEQEIAEQFQGLTAPSRAQRGRRGRRGVGRLLSRSERQTPKRGVQVLREVVEVSDDEEEDGEDEVSQIDSVDELEAAEMAAPRRGIHIVQKTVKTSFSAELGKKPDAIRGSSQRSAASNSQKSAPFSSPRKRADVSEIAASYDGTRTSQNVAVADSQPERTGSHTTQRLEVHSSVESNSRVLQSQYTPAYTKRSGEGVTKVSNQAEGKKKSQQLLEDPVAHVNNAEPMRSSPPALPPMEVDSDESESALSEEETGSLGEALGLPKETDELDDSRLEDAFDKSAVQASFGHADTDNDHTVRRQSPQDDDGAILRSVIPETDPADAPFSPQKSFHHTASNTHTSASNHLGTGTSADQSNSTAVFETARSRLSASPRKRIPGRKNETPNNTVHSPLPHLTLSEIAAGQSDQPRLTDIGSDINIMTEDDLLFNAIMSGSSPMRPAKKRRRIGEGQVRPEALRPPSREGSKLSPVTPPSTSSSEVRNELGSGKARGSRVASERMSGGVEGQKLGDEEELGHDTAMARSPQKAQPHKQPSRIVEAPRTKSTERAAARPKPQALHPRRKSSSTSIPEARDATTVTPKRNKLAARLQQQLASETPHDDIVAPKNVFALFRDGRSNYYPAVCQDTSLDGSRVRVRFYDNTESEVDVRYTMPLDLRVGDVVKVDRPSMRKSTYTVRGFRSREKHVAETSRPGGKPLNAVATDIRGFDTLALSVTGRGSTTGNTDEAAGDAIDVPIENIYITSTLWTRFKDRIGSTHISKSDIKADGVSTPINEQNGATTPHSRSRRQHTTIPSTLGTSLPKASHGPQKAAALSRSGLFAGMVFSITYGTHETQKNAVIAQLHAHGAHILESGFDELFDIPTPTTPTATTTVPTTHTDRSLPLRPAYLNVGFVALLSDSHSRRVKHMQALALGLPVLHGRWVADCVRAARVVPWQKYLLPAGASAYLDDAVRSRSLASYDPLSESGKLKNVLARRDRLLCGEGVLLVDGSAGRSKITLHKGFVGTVGGLKKLRQGAAAEDAQLRERRNLCAFVTRAMGAGAVAGVDSLEEARAVVLSSEQGMWKWIYVDGDVGEAQNALWADGGSGHDAVAGGVGVESKVGRKRKRGRGVEVERVESGGADKSALGGVKVVGVEFVLQTLILGALLEE